MAQLTTSRRAAPGSSAGGRTSRTRSPSARAIAWSRSLLGTL